MSSSELVTLLRVLLHDTDAGFSTINPVFQDEEIIGALNTSRDELVKLAIGSPQPPQVTLRQIIRTATGTTGSAVPADFYKLICGQMADGRYVPAQSIRVAEAMADTPAEQIYAKAGKFLGTADIAVYWAIPSQSVDPNVSFGQLVEFPEGFYHAVKYHAAMSLLTKEDDGGRDRFAAFGQELQRKMMSMQ